MTAAAAACPRCHALTVPIVRRDGRGVQVEPVRWLYCVACCRARRGGIVAVGEPAAGLQLALWPVTTP